MAKATRHVPSALSAWIAELEEVWPHLSRPQTKVLAEYSLGMTLAEGSGLPRVAFCLSQWLKQRYNTVRERLRDFYCGRGDKSGKQRRELVVEQCFPGLLAWILRRWRGDHLALALDATTLGQRFVVLSLSVVYRGSAMPVAWKVLPATAPEAWKPHWQRLLHQLKGVIPAQMQVMVMADRGLYAKWLYEAIVALGWHPFLRINREGADFRPAPTGPYQSVRDWVKARGQTYAQRGTLFRSRDARMDCTLVGCWMQGYEEPWLMVTDLPPDQAEPARYGLRSWIERGFKHAKSGGLRWQHTRMTDPQRAERQWLVMAVSQVRAMLQGSEQLQHPAVAVPRPVEPPPPPFPGPASAAAKRRRYPTLSVFLAGLLLGRLLLGAGQTGWERPELLPTPWPTGLPTGTALPQVSPQARAP